MSTICSICNRDGINVLTEDSKVNHKGKSVTYAMHYSLCRHCGHEYINPDQIRENEAALKKAWAEAPTQ